MSYFSVLSRIFTRRLASAAPKIGEAAMILSIIGMAGRGMNIRSNEWLENGGNGWDGMEVVRVMVWGFERKDERREGEGAKKEKK